MITSQDQVSAASDADLLSAYAHYTGRMATGFDSRAVAERRVVDAMMASAEARGWLGVPKGARPFPTGRAELIQLARAKGRELAPEPGSLKGVHLAEAPTPADPTPVRKPRQRGIAELAGPGKGTRASTATQWVSLAPGRPTARLNATSERAAVFNFVQACGGSINIGALVGQFGPGAKGHVQKLIKSNHLTNASQPSQEQSK